MVLHVPRMREPLDESGKPTYIFTNYFSGDPLLLGMKQGHKVINIGNQLNTIFQVYKFLNRNADVNDLCEQVGLIGI